MADPPEDQSGTEARIFPPSVPDEFADAFAWFDDQVLWLHVNWLTYVELFGDKRSVEHLNNAGGAARVIQKALSDDLVMRIMRLTDPARSGDEANIVIDSFHRLVKTIPDNDVRKRFSEALKRLRATCEVFREHRNRRIAHAGRELALKVAQLTPLSRKPFEDALTSFRDAMNVIHLHFHKSIVAYEHVSFPRGGRALVQLVEDGMRLRHIRKGARTLGDHIIATAVKQRRPYYRAGDVLADRIDDVGGDD